MTIANFIINDLPKEYSELREKIINKVGDSFQRYEARRKISLYFETISILSDTFTTSTVLTNSNYGFKSLDKFIELKKDMEKIGKSYNELIKEKKYVDLYQNFEDFFSDISFALYYYLSKKLKKNLDINEFKLSSEYDKLTLFPEVEKKTVKNYSSIYDKFIQIKKDFNLFNNISVKKIKNLYVHSLNRNKIIHSYGKVDKIYLNKLKKLKIKSRYALNEEISKNLDSELNDIEPSLKELVDEINYSIQIDTISLIKNYF